MIFQQMDKTTSSALKLVHHLRKIVQSRASYSILRIVNLKAKSFTSMLNKISQINKESTTVKKLCSMESAASLFIQTSPAKKILNIMPR